MKFYLPLCLLFLFLFVGNNTVYAEENSKNERASPASTMPHHTPLKEHHDAPGPLYSEHSDHPDLVIDREEHESDTFQAKFLNMLFLLALLIGFMILASWALKRLMSTKITQLNGSGNIKILETRYLSPRATLYLVEIQDRTILIAESPTAMSLLATFPQEPENLTPSSSSSNIKLPH